MERLTTDTPSGNFGNAINCAYAQDMRAWIRHGGPDGDKDIQLEDLVRSIAKARGLDDYADMTDEQIQDTLIWDETPTSEYGELALLYQLGWVCAELRERLKSYEDAGLMPEDVAKLKEKATPKEAEYVNQNLSGQFSPICPVCGQDLQDVFNDLHDFCPECGQAISYEGGVDD